MKKESNSFRNNDSDAMNSEISKDHQDDFLEEVGNEESSQIQEDVERDKTKEDEGFLEETEHENNARSLEKKCDEYFSKMQRVAADFENYKKRVSKERETTYVDALAEAVLAFLPVIDNFERALKTSSNGEDESFRKGIEMLFKQFGESFKKLGIQEIETRGRKFDPEFHNAVMHVEDENFGDAQIIEEFQKGYILGEKVIRHSMVKVAN
jgi:molecular chaperone GrpE